MNAEQQISNVFAPKSLKELNTFADIDIYCSTSIKDSDTAFFPGNAAQLLKFIVFYCIKENLLEHDQLLNIINSDKSSIKALLNKYPETTEGCALLDDERISSNILQIIRFNLSQEGDHHGN